MDLGATFSDFLNADLTVTRPEGSRGAGGYSESGPTTVLSCRCDAQDQGRTTQTAEEVHEGGSISVYAQGDVSAVQAGDRASISFDDGRSYEGSVQSVSPIDSRLTVERD